MTPRLQAREFGLKLLCGSGESVVFVVDQRQRPNVGIGVKSRLGEAVMRLAPNTMPARVGDD